MFFATRGSVRVTDATNSSERSLKCRTRRSGPERGTGMTFRWMVPPRGCMHSRDVSEKPREQPGRAQCTRHLVFPEVSSHSWGAGLALLLSAV